MIDSYLIVDVSRKDFELMINLISIISFRSLTIFRRIDPAHILTVVSRTVTN